MILVPDQGFVLIEFVGSLDGQTIINTFHYRIDASTPGESTPLEWIRAGVVLALKEPYLDLMTEAFTLRQVRSRDVTALSNTATQVFAIEEDGAVEGDTLPPTVAVVITKRTDARGPAGRGRDYLSAVPQAYALGGSLTQEAVDFYGVLGTAIKSSVVVNNDVAAQVGTAVPVVFHRDIEAGNPITETTVQSVLRVQRRREVGFGI